MIATSAEATSLSPWWRHSAILVMIAGFSVLSLVTVLTYTNAPPIPEQAVDVTGTVVFTGADIQMGQEVFLKYGLMERTEFTITTTTVLPVGSVIRPKI